MTGHAAEPRVSVRALILALARFEIASKDQTRALEKAWARNTASSTGWTLKEEPCRGSRKAARMKIAGRGSPPQNLRKRVLRGHAPVD